MITNIKLNYNFSIILKNKLKEYYKNNILICKILKKPLNIFKKWLAKFLKMIRFIKKKKIISTLPFL